MNKKIGLIGLLLVFSVMVHAGDIDITAPVITLVGDSVVTVQQNTPYVDAGATALDETDGDLTGLIVTVNPVDTSVLGTYYVTYDVSDEAGNAAETITRTVNIIEAPVEPTNEVRQGTSHQLNIESPNCEGTKTEKGWFVIETWTPNSPCWKNAVSKYPNWMQGILNMIQTITEKPHPI